MSPKSLYRGIYRSKLVRNILTLFSGKLTAQLILIGSAPIISRLFTPSDYGIAALVLAIAMIASPLATLGYGTAAQMAPSDADARRLINFIFGSTLFFASAFGIVLVLYSQNGGGAIFSNFKGWEWAIPILFVLQGAESALESWNTRMKNFKVQAKTYVVGAALGTGSRVAFGATAGSSVGGLVLGHLIGLVTRVFLLARSTDLFGTATANSASSHSYKVLVAQYRDFPFYAMPTNFLRVASKKLPLLFFGAAFSPAVAGFYAMADRLFFGPLILLQSSFANVFTQHLIDKKKTWPQYPHVDFNILHVNCIDYDSTFGNSNLIRGTCNYIYTGRQMATSRRVHRDNCPPNGFRISSYSRECCYGGHAAATSNVAVADRDDTDIGFWVNRRIFYMGHA